MEFLAGARGRASFVFMRSSRAQMAENVVPKWEQVSRWQVIETPRSPSPKTKYSLINAKQHFEEHLCVGNYYSEEPSIAGLERAVASYPTDERRADRGRE